MEKASFFCNIILSSDDKYYVMYSTPLTKDVEGGCSNYLFITVWSNKKQTGDFDVAKSTE